MFKSICFFAIACVLTACGSNKSTSNENHEDSVDVSSNQNKSSEDSLAEIEKASASSNDNMSDENETDKGITSAMRKVEKHPSKKETTAVLEGVDVVFSGSVVYIDDVEISLESEIIEELDSESPESQILLQLAKNEEESFVNNISLDVKNVTKKLSGKYSYEIKIANNNKVLSLEDMSIRVEFKGKTNEDLGKTLIKRAITLVPGESVVIDWAIDWAFLEDGTRTCLFILESAGNNIASFEGKVGVGS